MALQTLPLFPLGTILFPGGLLPLKLFEQRYLEMAKACMRDDSNFGVCGIRHGTEVGTPAVPFAIGCIGKIIHWDMPQLGILHIVALGVERFHVKRYASRSDGLLIGEVEEIPNDATENISSEFSGCVAVLKAIIAGVGEQRFHTPLNFDDATWVSNRLAEVLPLTLPEKQQLLELQDAHVRLVQLTQILSRQGLLAPPNG